MQTLLLNPATWDLLIDATGNIAVASEPYANAQDVASAIQTWRGEVYYDQTLGIPYMQSILGQSPSVQYINSQMEKAALTVPDVVKAKSGAQINPDRSVSGGIQIINTAGQTADVQFK